MRSVVFLIAGSLAAVMVFLIGILCVIAPQRAHDLLTYTGEYPGPIQIRFVGIVFIIAGLFFGLLVVYFAPSIQ